MQMSLEKSNWNVFPLKSEKCENFNFSSTFRVKEVFKHIRVRAYYEKIFLGRIFRFCAGNCSLISICLFLHLVK